MLLRQKENAMEKINCPKCGKSHYQVGSTTTTAMYTPTIVQNGTVVSKDRNYYTTDCICLECGNVFKIIERAGVIEAIL